MKIEKLMIDGKVVKYTEYGTLVYHDDFTERVKQLLEVMTPKEVEAIYATHDFEEDSFYEIEPGIYLFGTVEEEVVDMEVKSVDYSNAVWAPGHHPDNFNFYYCNRTTNRRTEAEGWGHWTGGVRKTAYIYFANNRRMKAKVWSTNYGTHSTGGFFTKNQRRRLRVWWESDADIVSISVKAKTYHPHPTTSIYYPLYYIPGPPNHHNGTEEDFNKNKVKIGWPPYTLTFVYSPGSPITKQCKPQYEFSPGWNPVEQNKPYACKPTWKFSKRVKIKESESCHYVKRGNQDGEIRILINKNID